SDHGATGNHPAAHTATHTATHGATDTGAADHDHDHAADAGARRHHHDHDHDARRAVHGTRAVATAGDGRRHGTDPLIGRRRC
ncbi:MAG: hypothetical protein H0U01_06595, partial [Acidimicrobiia bacterium]|nr:hypothetical protein [Acidimicrobiia bacterium]